MQRKAFLALVALLSAAVTAQPAAAQTELLKIDAYADEQHWSCLTANPSCARDHWSLERNELQDDTRVTYVAIGARLTTERRFAEAVNLVWQWQDGKSLLRRADDAGVLVIAFDYDRPGTFASYSPQRDLITVNRRFVAAPTWMVATVLVHELTHSSDHTLGVNQRSTTEDCLADETAAFDAERRFLVWLTRTLEPQGLPPLERIAANVSQDHALLARNLYELGLSDALPRLVQETYEGAC